MVIDKQQRTMTGALGWQLALAAATIAGTLATSCMVPFVALATVTAVTMPRRQAAATLVGIWAVNQLLGFTLLGYPVEPTTLAEGGALGVTTLAAMIVAAAVLDRDAPTLSRLTVAFLSAFIFYEGVLFCFALVAGGTDTFTAGIISRILLNDACWCAALVVIHAVLTRAAPRTFGSPLGLAPA